MNLNSLLQIIAAKGHFRRGGKPRVEAPPVLVEGVRFPYGPFRFRFTIPSGIDYLVATSKDLVTWEPAGSGTGGDGTTEYIDSDAYKFNWRFYRICVGETWSANVLGYAAVSLPPGFSLIANPFGTDCAIGDTFKDWPNGTTLHRFDTTLFRLVENEVKEGLWANTSQRLAHAEGAIFFNPTSDYKSASFVGEVAQGQLALPVPSGFSVRSSPVPQAGNLADDLKFPIAEGDVIHVFDRERQKYVLHPYKDGKWTEGAPIVSVGEAFWVAKTSASNWVRSVTIPT